MSTIAQSMTAPYSISAGRAYPLGATVDGDGVNFALFSANGQKVELCLFDANGEQEIARLALPEFTDEVWHGYIHGLPVGTLYGYRVYGPFEPHNGHRFNDNKLLLDPYAKQLHGKFIHSDTHLAYDQQSNQSDLTLDMRDNAPYLPKCVVTQALPNCHTHQAVRGRDTIIYELHVKGFTQQNPDVPVDLQGTFAGLAQDSVCQYLTDLGITSVELMPVQSFIDETFVVDKGLSNYWGYNSLSFFVPEARYSHSGDPAEFKQLVEKFHQHGIEVLLDVVYNHTAEGDQRGPTLSFKGIDNASYYRLQPQDKRYYVNDSGCGNTLDVSHPRVLQLLCDSLRYWVEVMGVDGFRFDLATILGREQEHFSARSHFFSTLKQDPTLAKVKLIAEPWDIGNGGYQLGRFPNDWMEWNDRFRDTSRRFWRGDQSMVPEFARRLHGSSDLFEQASRRPSSSVNFITSHDGFTLHDLVSYNEHHNQANGEQNKDGHHSNFSTNFGVEGETDNATIKQLRARQQRNLLTTLFIAQGTPMLLAGDEVGNSQQGNNNAYCQDNSTSWLSWQAMQVVANGSVASHDQTTLAFVKQLIALRKAHPLLNRTHYQHGIEVSAKTGLTDISWLNCHGDAMQESNWHDPMVKCFAMLLAETDHLDEQLPPKLSPQLSPKLSCHISDKQQDDALLIIFNAHQCDTNYVLPKLDGDWQCLINTANYQAFPASAVNGSNDKTPIKVEKTTGAAISVAAHSCLVLSFSQTKQPSNSSVVKDLAATSNVATEYLASHNTEKNHHG